MMKKKWMPHVLAAVALALFVGLGLASDGTTPTGGGGGCPGGPLGRCFYNAETTVFNWCQRHGRCRVGDWVVGGPSISCNC